MSLDELLSRLGRSIMWLIDHSDNGSGREPPAVEIQRTGNGGFCVGGFQFASEAEALGFIKARKLEAFSGSPTPPDRSGCDVTNQPSPEDQQLMAQYGIRRGDDAGYHAAGYVFHTLNQAVDWIKRRRMAANPALRSDQPTLAPGPSRSPPPSVNFVLPGWGQRVTSAAPPVPAAQWIREPTTLVADGFRFTADMIHFGKRDPKDYQYNKGLIDPTLKVSAIGDPAGTTLRYWPDYQGIDPRARRTYLEWLDTGRCDPDIPIGYVFIFFYGLEYHLLKEAAHEDVVPILVELRRLREIYGHNSSFWRYAHSLIEVAELIAGDKDESAQRDLQPQSYWQMPLALRVRLGRKVANGTPILANDALAWLLGTGTYLRTPAQRCFAELRELFAKRFEKRWPQGILVPLPKRKLLYHYRAAGANFSAEVTVGDLPDVSSLTTPVNRFKTLLERCTEELELYSRFLGRNADRRGSLAAATMLPPELREGEAGKRLTACRAELIGLCSASSAAPVIEVMKALEIDVPQDAAKIPVPLQTRMASMLDMMGFGYEPDRRYGAKTILATNATLGLFESPSGGKVDPNRAAYHAARTMVEIATLAASSDGEVVAAEVQTINRDIASFSGLDDVERQRLGALASALLNDPPKRREAIERLTRLAEPVRRKIIDSAVSAIVADGQVLPAEVRFLESLHLALGLPQNEVYALLHRANQSDTGPLTVAVEKRSKGVRIPAERKQKEGAVELDELRLERIRSETLQVSELLADIFIDDSEVAATVSPQQPTKSRFDGLERAHGELLWNLLAKPVAPDEFETLARSLKLLPEGAIEAINEWGIDTFDEPVIDNEDLILVPQELAERLRIMGELA